MTLFPSGDIYGVYVADPHRADQPLAESFIVGGGITDTRSPLTQVATGGRFGMLRFGPATPGRRAWQISVEAGFDALFDSQNKLDVVGWDGNYRADGDHRLEQPAGVEVRHAARLVAHRR